MLVEFHCENVRSFDQEMRLSLEATSLAEGAVPRDLPWREGGRSLMRVLPAAAVFGANASGKTNVLRAMADMRNNVLHSFETSRTAGVQRKPFLLDPEAASWPSRFGIDVIIKGIRHTYEFALTSGEVLEEAAYRYPKGKAALLFRREGGEVQAGAGNRGKARAVTEILRPGALYLSAAAAAGHPDLLPLFRWFEANMLLVESANRSSRWSVTAQRLRNEDRRPAVLAMLQAADLGISGAQVREIDPQLLDRYRRAMVIVGGDATEADSDEGSLSPLVPADVIMSHRGKQGHVEFDIADESQGTLVWLGLIGPVLDSLAAGSVLLVDELDASLHPALVQQVVRLYQDPQTNPLGAQLIFNTNETTLLGDSVGDRVLGRDQVWFTEKLQGSSSHLYPLSDLSPRRQESLSRRYRAGRYGATPIVSPQEFAEVAAGAAAGGRP